MKKILIFLILLCLFLNFGCTAKLVDPYYKSHFSCPIDENGFSHCESLDKSYHKIINSANNSNVYYSQSNISYSRAKNQTYPEIKKGTSPVLKGTLIGTGTGLAGGGLYAFLKKNSKNKVVPILVGALIGGGIGALTGKLIEFALNKKRKITKQEYKNVYQAAKNYSDCVFQILKENKPVNITAKEIEKCSVYIADLPGIGFYKSEDIENMFKLKLQREYLVKKELSRATENSSIIPFMTPPKIVKVLITPYVDKKNIFHQGENIFVVVDQGKWIIPQRSNLESGKMSDVLKIPEEVIQKLNQEKKENE